MDKMRGGGGQKMSVFVHAYDIKTVHAGGGVKKWQNSVHIVVECPLTTNLSIIWGTEFVYSFLLILFTVYVNKNTQGGRKKS